MDLIEPTFTPAQTWLAILVFSALALVALVALVAWVKGKKRPGEYVFRASRLSRGNRLLPAQVVITPDSVTYYQPQWIGKIEKSIHMTHVSSINIDTNLLFSTVLIESTGGHNAMACQGHTKGDAIRIKETIETFQSERYQTR